MALMRALFAKVERFVYSKIHTNLINKVCGQNAGFVTFKQGAHRSFVNQCVILVKIEMVLKGVT
jgi:hypothetical protein